MKIDFSTWDLPALAKAWHEARPFPYVIIDDLVAPEDLQALRTAIAGEPHYPNHGELYAFMASSDPPQHPVLLAFMEALGTPHGLASVAILSGKVVTRVELRSYAYLPGSYLLPHSDHRPSEERTIAFAYYLSADPFAGGELELFDATIEHGEITKTTPAARIEPRANRIVIFDVTLATLHQVREVESGIRLSLAGWYYP